MPGEAEEAKPNLADAVAGREGRRKTEEDQEIKRSLTKLGVAAALAAMLLLPACLPLVRRPLVDKYVAFPEAPKVGSAGPLTARFLGTSTLILSDGETTIMTDGFLSRPSAARLALLPVTPNRLRIEHALLRARATNVQAIFVAQSHHDHAMDTPYVAKLTSAKIFGSRSTRNIALGAGFPEERVEVMGHRSRYRIGRFEVTVFRTPHSSPTPFPGEIPEKLSRYAGVEDYREGGNFSFLVEHPERRILIVPSRGCWTGQFEGVVADVVFLGIGGAGTKDRLMQDHWREAVVRTGATTVYPIHWDNFFRPLHKPLASLVPGSFKKRLTFLKGLAEESGGRIRVIEPKTWDEIAMKATPPVPPDVPRQPPPPLPSPPRRCGDSA